MKYEKLLPFYYWLWKFWRENRWRRFRQYLAPDHGDSLVDIGGTVFDWLGRKDLVGKVDVINLQAYPVEQREDSPFFRSMKGDGRKLEFADGSYDIAFSNSVIEHVGGWEDQQAFAQEARRVGRGLWVQTPAYGCPVEPHYLGLFLHWFPARWHVPLARWTSVVGLTRAADLHSIADHTRLLSKREMRILFPDCEIWTERLFFFFPKSHVAYRRKAGAKSEPRSS